VKVMANSLDLKLYSRDGHTSPQKSHNSSLVDLTTSTPPATSLPMEDTWVRSLNLHKSDRDVLWSGWLNDRVVDAVNKSVAQELGVASQSTVLPQSKSSFDAISTDTVMILHALGHWITVAGNAEGVTYIDSHRPHQIIIYRAPEKKIDSVSDRKASDLAYVTDLLDGVFSIELHEQDIEKMYRLGCFSKDKARPLLVAFKSQEQKDQIMVNLWKLKQPIEKFRSISISHDFHPKEREERKRLLAEAKQEHEANESDQLENYNS